MPVRDIFPALVKEALELANKEPLLKSVLEEQIVFRESFAEILAVTLSRKLASSILNEFQLETLFLTIYRENPSIIEDSAEDLWATLDRDAACHSALEPLLFFKGYQAIQAYRIAHALWKTDRQFLAEMLQSLISQKLAVDIHPAAKIGHGILLDHATDLVIGETARVGNNVSILHGVTLGGTGNETGERHPKVGDGVMLGAHAQLLGNIHIGKGAKIGAGAVVLDDVPPHTTVAGVPAVKVGHPENAMPSLEMQQDFTLDAKDDSKK
ncbi:MAG: serine O-acetyltransferase [Fibrobacteraceae bacterium]|nr:serine O-acetyltransferase [Fibrobacteraceae bacterium]